MIAFVIPVKSRAAACAWPRVSGLLDRTLRSVCGQAGGDFAAVVVCHERPAAGALGLPGVRVVEVDYPVELDAGAPAGTPDRRPAEAMRVDKGRKLFRGVAEARRMGASHIMFVDADDLVSNRLALRAAAGGSPHGWYLPKGYSYDEGSRWVYAKRRHFHVECGTGHILAADAIPVPAEPEYDRGFDYYRFVLNHGRIVEKMARRGTPLRQLEFPGAIYTQNGENFYRSHTGGRRSLLRTLLNTRPITARLRAEFGLFALAAGPRPESGAAGP